jgi:hypothetical protein
MGFEEVSRVIGSIPVDDLSTNEKAQLFKLLQERLLGFALPGSIEQSLSFGSNQVGVQIVEGSINLNVLDAGTVLQAVEKIIEKDPEFMIKLAGLIARQARE